MRWGLGGLALVALLASAASAAGAASLESVEVSLDRATGSPEQALGAAEVGEAFPGVPLVPSGPGVALPPGANLVAFHRLGDGDVLFVPDVHVRLGRHTIAGPRQVVRVTPSGAEIALDAASLGVPPGTGIDAVAVLPSGDWLLSFDVDVRLGDQSYPDHALVQVDAKGAASLHLDPARLGLDPALDLDAVSLLASGGFLASFDVAGRAAGVGFTDDDLVELGAAGLEQGLGLAFEAGLVAADLDAAHVHEVDTDGDGVPDPVDNCRWVPNPGQADANAFEDDDTSQAGEQHYGDACDADLNEDGLVAPDDFFAGLRPCMGLAVAQAPACAEADLDGDGVVGPADFFGVFRPALGTAPGPGIDG